MATLTCRATRLVVGPGSEDRRRHLFIFSWLGRKSRNDLSCLETLPCVPASWGVLLWLTEAIPFSKASARTWFKTYFSEGGIQESWREYERGAILPWRRLSPNTKSWNMPHFRNTVFPRLSIPHLHPAQSCVDSNPNYLAPYPWLSMVCT